MTSNGWTFEQWFEFLFAAAMVLPFVIAKIVLG